MLRVFIIYRIVSTRNGSVSAKLVPTSQVLDHLLVDANDEFPARISSSSLRPQYLYEVQRSVKPIILDAIAFPHDHGKALQKKQMQIWRPYKGCFMYVWTFKVKKISTVLSASNDRKSSGRWPGGLPKFTNGAKILSYLIYKNLHMIGLCNS